MSAMAYSSRFDQRRGGQYQQFNWRGWRCWGQELCQAQAKFLSVTTALASRDTIKSKSYRMVCSNAQPEESGNQDYDDHDADDVKDVHCTLRSRHARLQVKARCSHRKHFETILSSGVRETIKSVRLDHRELVPTACHRHQGTSRSRRLALQQLFFHQHR